MKAYECLCRGDIEMISETGTAHERKMAIAAYQLQQLEALRKFRKDADVGAHDKDGLFRLLKGKWGHLPAAWRNHYDTMDIGVTGRIEFCIRCREIGYIGDTRLLFAELDKGGENGQPKGFLTLKDIDPVAYAEMEESGRLNACFRLNCPRKDELDLKCNSTYQVPLCDITSNEVTSFLLHAFVYQSIHPSQNLAVQCAPNCS